MHHSAWALVICALALLLGMAVVDDYGVFGDTQDQRAIGAATLRHLAGEDGLNRLWPPWNRLYGPIFEAQLALLERVLDSEDSRSLYLARHLLTHLFFLAAGFAGYLLAYRMFGSRWLGLFALALFLLHPRIYANSFFNSKDVPFLAMFMICLWLAHRAFRPSGNGTAIHGAFAICGAFAVCGVAAAVLTNLRVGGVIFVAVVVFMCLCDVVLAAGWRERRRVIASGTLFALSFVCTYYATMPYLWTDPVERFAEILRVLSAHPANYLQLFQGESMRASEIPRSYLPVWFGITTPPLALLLGIIGFAALVWRIAAALFRPGARLRAMLGNTPLRFEVLVAACFVLPVLAVILLQPNLYNGWRQLYFLFAPFVLLATSGLGALVGCLRRALALLSPRVPAAVVGGSLAALGLGGIAYEMARLHPHQHLYFNLLANRPGVAAPQRFQMFDEFGRKHSYAHILEEFTLKELTLEELADPEEHADEVFNIHLYRARQNEFSQMGAVYKPGLELFGQREQKRFASDRNADPDFYVNDRAFPPSLYERRVYGQLIVRVTTPDLSRVDDATADAYRTLYRDATATVPALRGDVDVYRSEAAITWVKEDCAEGDLHRSMTMIALPLDGGGDRHEQHVDGVRIGDACLWQTPLPAHAIAKIIFPRIGALASDAYLEERRRGLAAISATPPAARSTFDVYLQDRTLFYVKTPCVQKDAEAPFFVHVRPARVGDLPRSRRLHGFDTLDFRFGGFDTHWNYAASDLFDGVCMATLELPDYPVASIATGQYVRGGAGLWRVDVDVGEDDSDPSRQDDPA